MEWKQVRAEYQRALQAATDRGMTQEQIAATAGLEQSYISKPARLNDDSRGPHLMNLLGVLEAIGITVSEFFAAVEARARGASPGTLTITPSSREEEQLAAIGRQFLKAHRLASASNVRKSTRPRRQKKPR